MDTARIRALREELSRHRIALLDEAGATKMTISGLDAMLRARGEEEQATTEGEERP